MTGSSQRGGGVLAATMPAAIAELSGLTYMTKTVSAATSLLSLSAAVKKSLISDLLKLKFVVCTFANTSEMAD